MDDLISRQAAIKEIIETYEYEFPTASGAFDEFATKIVPNVLKNLPSAQTEPCGDVPDNNVGECEDAVSRADAISVLDNFTQTDTLGHTPRQIVEALPSAQPEITEQQVKKYCEKRCLVVLDSSLFHRLKSAQPDRRYDEWCTDCKEYDQEKHCCPRWNRVIRTTLQDAQRTGRWKVSDIPKGKMKYCSECGFGQYIQDERIYSYCPNCGADMRGEQDG